MLETFSQFAETLVPSLRNAERVAAWSGIRPMTFDGFPMIGRVPEHPQLFVAAGHFRSGWHLAPATAKCMAALVLGDSPAVSLDAFNIGSKQTKSEQHASILTQ
jgi:glycine oxidase